MKPHRSELRWALTMVASMALGCAATQGCRQERKPAQPAVVLEDDQGHPVRVRVEVVVRTEDLEQGLMYRRHLDEDAGMLFVYTADGQRRFWMKNTYIPLDMLFIADNHRMVGVVENAVPLTLDNREVDAPSRFVLEVNGGYFQKHHLKLGGTVRFEDIDGLVP